MGGGGGGGGIRASCKEDTPSGSRARGGGGVAISTACVGV